MLEIYGSYLEATSNDSGSSQACLFGFFTSCSGRQIRCESMIPSFGGGSPATRIAAKLGYILPQTYPLKILKQTTYNALKL